MIILGADFMIKEQKVTHFGSKFFLVVIMGPIKLSRGEAVTSWVRGEAHGMPFRVSGGIPGLIKRCQNGSEGTVVRATRDSGTGKQARSNIFF